MFFQINIAVTQCTLPTIATLCIAILGATGCGPKVVEKKIPSEELNLRFIGMAYMQFITDKGHPPNSMTELKPTLKDFGDVDQLAKSPRDGKTYIIVPQGKILAHEQDGVAGKRYVVDRRFIAWEVDGAEFAKLGIEKKP